MNGTRRRRGSMIAAVLAAAATLVVVPLAQSAAPSAVLALPSTSEATIVTVTPARVLDTRQAHGFTAPLPALTSQKLTLTGSVAVIDENRVVTNQIVIPEGATGALLNVTALNATQAGFMSVRPGDQNGTPSTSSLNFQAGTNVPNAVTVDLPRVGANAGMIDIYYGAGSGETVGVLVDIVGYMTSTGLTELTNDVVTVTGDVTAMTATVGTLMADVAGVTANVATVTADVVGVTADVVAVTDDVVGVTADVVAVTDDVVGVTADVATVTADVATVTADVATVTADVATVTADVATVTDDVVVVVADVVTVAGDVVALTARVNTLEDDAGSSRTITVGGDGSDAENGTELQQAVVAASGAAAGDPYVIELEPGGYDVGSAGVTLPAYVTLTGAGEDVSILRGVADTVLTVGPGGNVSNLTIIRDTVTAATGAVLHATGDGHIFRNLKLVSTAVGIVGIVLDGATNVLVDGVIVRVVSASIHLVNAATGLVIRASDFVSTADSALDIDPPTASVVIDNSTLSTGAIVAAIALNGGDLTIRSSTIVALAGGAVSNPLAAPTATLSMFHTHLNVLFTVVSTYLSGTATCQGNTDLVTIGGLCLI